MLPRSVCAIVQLEGVHEEITPSFIRALNALGYTPHVYLNTQCRAVRGDIFGQIDRLKAEVTYVPLKNRSDWLSLRDKMNEIDYPFVLINTFQREGVSKWAEGLGMPILGVVHNPRIFLSNEASTGLYHQRRAHLICLAPHVASYFRGLDPAGFADRIGVVEPVFWGDQPDHHPDRDAWAAGRRHVAIPGGVSFRNRDFEGLVAALRRAGGADGVVFHVLGGGGDRAALEALIAEHGLQKSFVLAPLGESGRVQYDAYFEGLGASDLLLPLLPRKNPEYRDHKITSAIPTGLGFGLPLVMDRETMHVYRVPGRATGGRVAESLEAITGMSIDEYTALAKATRAYRTARLQANVAALREAIGWTRKRA